MSITVEFKNNTFNIACRYRKGRSKDTVLFIHGLGSSKEIFKDVFKSTLFKNKTLLTVDLLGHGDSEKPIHFSYSFENQAKMIIQILQNFTISNLFLVGHSAGAAVALLVCNYLKSKPKVFISVDGAICNDDTGEKMSFKEFIDNSDEILKHKLLCKDIKRTLPLAFIEMGKSLSSHLRKNTFLSLFLSLKVKKKHIYSSYINQTLINILESNDLLKVDSAGHFIMLDNPSTFYKTVYSIFESQS